MRQQVDLSEIGRILDGQPGHLCDLFMELRELIWETVPDEADELLRWGALIYCRDGAVIKKNICCLDVKDDSVQVGFVHGVALPDPEGLLVGAGKSKRDVKLASLDDVPLGALRDLLRAAAAYEPAGEHDASIE